MLQGLPVQFNLFSLKLDGTCAKTSVTQIVYMADNNGNVSAAVILPSGLYEIQTQLSGNSYYETAEATTRIVVYESSASTVT